MATISLALIIKDVEKTIDRCLSDFSQVADEIIIVDTGSTDNSKEIVKKYTDKIYDFKWIDDFSAARNFSFSKCTKDFILWVDGDDYAHPEDLQKIREIDYSDKEVILIDYIYAHDEFGNNKLVVPRERILKRSLNPKWQGEIHEVIPLSIGRNYKASGIKTHHNKQHGTSERNLAILERIVEKNPSTRNIYYLAKEYLDFGRHDESIHYFQEFIKRPDAYWEDIYYSHFKMALCYLNKDNEAKFKEHIFESIKIEERWAEPYYHLGLFYMNRKQWDKAIHWYKLASNVKRPAGLLTSYQPEYYTWLPKLNLCVCYNAIGDLEKAYECNKEVLKYRPKDIRALNNEKILSEGIKKKKKLKDGQGKKLNLGSGGKRIGDYVNVDLFEDPNVDEIFEFDDIPYKDGTIGGIYSEHALEHVPFKRAEKALKEWCRVLQPGAELELYMPDFEICCQKYIEAPLEDSHFLNTRAWFKFTIYGIQESQGGEPDEAQIHQCGFSKEEIHIVVERCGFKVISVENYGGPGQKPDYGTPSMFIKAVKATSILKIGWVSTENWIAAQTRIRVLKMNEWLRSHGYISSVISMDDAIKGDYDLIIIGKKFSEDIYEGTKKLKELKKKVYCDLCEDIIDWAWVNEILELCDKVICCSNTLADRVRPINSNVAIIEDAWEDK